MNNTMLAMYQTKASAYIKFLYTPKDWGIGITMDWDDESWELSVHLLCWQVWIGR
jgi:hypothetical protein